MSNIFDPTKNYYVIEWRGVSCNSKDRLHDFLLLKGPKEKSYQDNEPNIKKMIERQNNCIVISTIPHIIDDRNRWFLLYVESIYKKTKNR